MNNFKISIFQDQGDRDYQEDSYFAYAGEDWALIAVADGMGGHANGSEASATAIKALTDSLDFIKDAVAARDTSRAKTLVKQAYIHANEVCMRSGDDRGTTMVACLVLEGTAWFFNIGDSYGFYTRDYEPTQITVEHSGPWGNITRCIGGGPWGGLGGDVDVFGVPLTSEIEYLVVASDGILGVADAIPDDLDSYSAPQAATAIGLQGLNSYRIRAPGRADNVTVVALALQ